MVTDPLRLPARCLAAAALLATIVPTASVFAQSTPAGVPPSLELAGKTIVIDPGHGGWDPGTVDYGYREKDVTLAMGLQLQTTLRGRGAKVVMTRTNDVALGPDARADVEGRVQVAQQAHAHAFVSLHANSLSDPNVSGAITYYGPAYSNSRPSLGKETDAIRVFCQTRSEGAIEEIDARSNR
jgi:N-acetylmuramoyl-L-alanine amidase